jgi:predicted peroxiredoxin
MGHYLFIDARDPFESRDTEFVVSTAAALRQRGNDVTVFLVQNGVMAARKQARDRYLTAVANAGVRILADEFSLRERGIADSELHPAIRTAGVDAIVDMLAAGAKTIWH